MSFYLDASVLVPLFVLEPRTAIIRQWAAGVDMSLTVGQLAIVEIGSAISRKQRARELDEAESRLALGAADAWLTAVAERVDHDASDFAEAAVLVRRPFPKLLPADAIHVATARRLGLTLVTDDAGLQEVATLNRIDWLAPA